MKKLDEALVYVGVWITGLYLLGLVLDFSFENGLSETKTQSVLLTWSLLLLLLKGRSLVKGLKVNWLVVPLVAFGLLLALPLGIIGDHILGVDAHREYYTFVQTDSNDTLYKLQKSKEAACLSVSLLPVYFQDITKAGAEDTFRLLYPIVFGTTYPLCIFCIARSFVQQKWALLAGIVVCLQPLFIWTTANARTSLGVLFLCLVLIVLLSSLSSNRKTFLLVLLGIGCVLSYYGTTFVLLTVLLTCSLVKEVRKPSFTSLLLVIFGTVLWWKWTGIDELVTRYF